MEHLKLLDANVMFFPKNKTKNPKKIFDRLKGGIQNRSARKRSG
jgi:hypothetical protein